MAKGGKKKKKQTGARKPAAKASKLPRAEVVSPPEPLPREPAFDEPGEVAADAVGSPAAIDENPPFPPRDEPAPVGLLRKLDAGIGLLEQIALCGFLLALIGSGLVSAIAGNVFAKSIDWTAEVIRYSVFYIAMIGAALCAQKARMMSMDVLTRLMTSRQKAVTRVVTGFGVVFICVLLVMGGLHLLRETEKFAHPYDFISPEIGKLALPVGAGLIAFHYVLHLLIDLRYFAAGRIAPEAPEGPAH